MSITLELSREQERKAREKASKQDAPAVREILLQGVDTTVQTLLRSQSEVAREDDFETLADRLANTFAAANPANHRPLPDEALTRDGIYGDHP